MPPLRLPLTVALVAALLPALLCSSCEEQAIPDCGVPSAAETTADGSPDPCHCDPPASLNLQACPCLSGNSAQVDIYKACMAIYWTEVMDAGGGD